MKMQLSGINRCRWGSGDKNTFVLKFLVLKELDQRNYHKIQNNTFDLYAFWHSSASQTRGGDYRRLVLKKGNILKMEIDTRENSSRFLSKDNKRHIVLHWL